MQIVQSDTQQFEAALRRVRGRLDAQAETLSDAARELSMRVFGEALAPLQAVKRIISDVRRMGDAAISLYTEKFDRCQLSASEFRIGRPELDAAVQRLRPELLAAIRQAKENIYLFQHNMRPRAPRDIVHGDRTIGVRTAPLASAGLYAPHGLAPYPSTVLMTALPAKVAGVRRVVLCSPPTPDKTLPDEILAAAAECGVDEVYRIGGVQAVAALAYGTQSIRPVDKIVGPGRLEIQLAKKEVFGAVDIDQFAGPSEILVIADHTANPAWVAADLLSQAEHAPDASAILVTPVAALAERVAAEVERQVELLTRKDVARQSIDGYGLIVVASTLDQCVAIANEIAPEHLELHVEGAEGVAAGIRNAGAIFVGPYAPEAVGDYIAGPSHVLPTGGTARFFSGLSVTDFIRQWSMIYYSRQALRELQGPITQLAESEGFEAHARSAQARFRD